MRIFQGIKKKMVIYMIAQSPLSRRASHILMAHVPRTAMMITRAHARPTLQCGVNKIQSLRDCLPKALFCFCLTCLRAKRLRNAEPKEVARTMWECVSERHYLINPRLNAVQSGEGQRPSHHRTAGVNAAGHHPLPSGAWSPADRLRHSALPAGPGSRAGSHPAGRGP